MTEEATERATCGALARHSGAPCKRSPVPGRARCKFHGGASLRGPEHPRWRGRGYAADLPRHLADRHAAALLDPELTSLASEIAILDARLGELLARLRRDRPGLADAQAALADALRAEDSEATTAALARLQAASAGDADDDRTWGRILSVIERRRRLALGQERRNYFLRTHATAAQVRALIECMYEGMGRQGVDDATRLRVMQEVRALMGYGPPPEGASPALLLPAGEVVDAEALDDEP